MLSKKKIDKKLKDYIREHLGRGYSGQSVKKALVSHGYDENYVDSLLRKHSELQLVKAYSVFISLLFIVSFFAFDLFTIKSPPQEITGYAVGSSSNEGCCTSVCQQTSKSACYGKFVPGAKCPDLEQCNVGCCIDKEGYCLTNYLSGNCIGSNGTNINKDCKDIVFCRNITDKSYTSRRYSIKSKSAGFSALKPVADYYNSSFNIQYYLYDKANVISVRADIKDSGKIIDSIELYDDGSHNDGAKNDNLYGNNWPSTKIRDFDGFKKLDVGISVKYDDNTIQSIGDAGSAVVLNNNKCLPIINEWHPNQNPGIIFAADHYEEQQKFEADVQNFIGVLFSIDKLPYKQSLNIYRLDQSLSYFNMPTLASIASGSCPSYSNRKDMILVLDNDEKYCVHEGLRMIRVNPKALFYKNITGLNATDAFADFCSFTLTPQKLADEIIAFASPPTIVVHTLENVTYNTSANLSFSISATNYPLNTSVFLDSSLVFNKISNEESRESILLNLTKETSLVFIKAVDRNRNKAFAQILLNSTK
ncbi:hypothetical protein HYX08_04600 [Candidatus Woesearchaeota archaeon]|nr:hypothetical protein [Candidatus Woesearchaeota archaeon]